MRIVLVFVLCLLIGVTYAQSHSDPKINPSRNEQPTSQDKRGSQEFPIFIKGDVTTRAVEKTEHDRKEEKDKQNTDRWIMKFTGIAAVCTFLLVVVTGVLAFFTYRLWYATGKLVKGAEDTAERQLRAYILPEKAWLTNIEDPRPTYSFQAKNYGQTPASQLTVWVGWRYFDIGEIEIPTERPEIPNLSKFIIGPQGFTLNTDQVYLNDERKKKIRDGKAIFFILGDIRYKDIFGTNRITRFRFAWGAGYEIGPAGALMVHAEGNETDESE